MENQQLRISLLQIFLIFLRLGCTSFGGPVAHLGYFRHEFVETRKWITEENYASLVALCQFLPGPASSQVGIALGWRFGGYFGAFLAFIGFTMPSVVLLILFALNLDMLIANIGVSWLHGLKLVAVAVVAHALWGMARNFCIDKLTLAITFFTACVVLLVSHPFIQIMCLIVAGSISFIFSKRNLRSDSVEKRGEFESMGTESKSKKTIGGNNSTSLIFLSCFFLILIGMPIVLSFFPNPEVQLFDSFYRSGALVFGGGHVVLPLLQSEVAQLSITDQATFLSGYGAAQAVPGPLFTFAAFLGASNESGLNGWLGGGLASFAIFLPAWLLILGAMPIWEKLQDNSNLKKALHGVNACVVGILLAALYDPIWTTTVNSSIEFLIALGGFFMLTRFAISPIWVVILMPLVSIIML